MTPEPTSTPEPSASPGLPPELSVHGAIASVTLRRPEVANRLDLSDVERLLEHVAAVNADPAIRVLQVTSTGRHFCSGFNLAQMGSDSDEAARLFEALAQAIEDARPVTVAVIRGGAFGGAVDLAVACDFRIATTACEMFIPASRLGLHFYRSGMERLVSRVGLGAAKRLLLAAHTLMADELLACGLLNKCVAEADLEPESARWCSELSERAPLALLPMKQHLNAIARGRLNVAVLLKDAAAAAASEDLQEGSRAWAEKRAPRFTGR